MKSSTPPRYLCINKRLHQSYELHSSLLTMYTITYMLFECAQAESSQDSAEEHQLERTAHSSLLQVGNSEDAISLQSIETGMDICECHLER